MECPYVDHKGKITPRDLNSCKVANDTTMHLRNWAEKIYNIGVILFWIIVGLAVIMTSVAYYGNEDILPDEQLAEIITSSIVTWGLYAAIEFVAYNVLALILSALASITYSSHISANIALYEASKKFPSGNADNNTNSPKVSPSQKDDMNWDDYYSSF